MLGTPRARDKGANDMIYQLITYPTMLRREVLDTYPSYKAATDAVHSRYQIYYFEQDTDVDYAAADFITEQGAIYSIEPMKGAN
jgi:5-methylcytosine-specific restriction endonuclease McrBC regulatory subunit McrC